MMPDGISVTALLHIACALTYGALASLILLRSRLSATGSWLAAACVAAGVWALVASLSAHPAPGGPAGCLDILRAATWYGFLLHLYRLSVSRRKLSPVFAIMGVAAGLLAGGAPLAEILARHGLPAWLLLTASHLCLAIFTILLVENLYLNTPVDARWHIILLCVAVGGISLYDLLLYSDALLFLRISPLFFDGRASIMILCAPLIAVAAARNRRWAIDIHVSRAAVFHSATLVASGLFLLGLAGAGEVFRRGGAVWGNVAEISLIAGGVLLLAVLLTSGSARSRLRALLLEHFFSHRYDYRLQWMQCIATLSASEEYIGLQTRAIRAVAEIVDSPGGVLFVRDPEDVAFRWAGSWNMAAATLPIPAEHPVIAAFRGRDWIATLDRADKMPADWLAELPGAWLAVPLSHLGRLIGFVVVSRPRAPFRLDREVFDLLRIVGHEVASHVAEQRATQVLTDMRQLQDYSKRFAFAIHDIKNVSGQLSMLVSNAELHGENPAFQRDVLSTIRASAEKISRLLARLQARERGLNRKIVVPIERLTEIATSYMRARGVSLQVDHDGRTADVAMDAGSFDAVITHLLDNAIEASDGPVRLRVRHQGLSVLIDVIDAGPGMSPEFVRDSLFRPFASTKRSGHGIGVYQARELLREIGGDLIVFTRQAVGTTMRVLVPAIGACTEEPAPLSA